MLTSKTLCRLSTGIIELLDMNHRYSLLFVLVDATPWREAAQRVINGDHVSVPVSGDMACMLVQAGNVNRIDSNIEEWVLATATRFAQIKERYLELTPRERQALPLITDGMLNKQAASVLGISEATLQIHRRRIMQKMAARSFADLVRIADVLGISMIGDGEKSSDVSLRSLRATTFKRQLATENST